MARLGLACGAAVLALLVAAAESLATWSMIIVDTRTGEIAVGSCTCLTNLDLQARTPVLIVGVGGATAQSATDATQYNRTFIRDRMAAGMSPSEILTGLAGFDQAHASRQYGFVDVKGRAATYTGSEAGAWAGGQTGSFVYTYAGQVGTITYAVQGNVLTGAPVVQAAVDALRNTEGDVPRRMLAAMEAARAMGGDGRCSCPGGVTTCGAPPASFTKSAHIGYMLVARAGDKDGSTGVYATGPTSMDAAFADFDVDGRRDVAVLNATPGATVSLMMNETPPGSAFARLGAATNVTVIPGSRVIAMGDLGGDGVSELVTLSDTAIGVRAGLGGVGFGPSVTTGIPGVGLWLALRNMDAANGLDVLGLTTTSTLFTALNDGAGALQTPLTRTAGTSSTGFGVADVDGSGSLDVVVVSKGTTRLLVLKGSNNGVYTAGTPVLTPPSPQAVALADFNGDGVVDIACANQGVSPSMTVYFNNGAGVFTLAQTVALPASPTDVVAGDLNGDGSLDLVSSTNASRFLTLLGSPSGAFALSSNSPVLFAIGRVAVADLNGDGRADVVYPIASQGSVGVSTARPDGSFPSQSGTGGGDYFMTLNVPNQAAGAPDPVVQLQTQFDAWRAGLTGKVDAVQTMVSVPELSGTSFTGSSGVLGIQLRDWRGEAVTTSGVSITIERVGGGAGIITAGPVVMVSPGVYEATVSVPAMSAGIDRFVVTVEEAGRRVVLMPQVVVRALQCVADFNGDNDYGTDADIEAFFACLAGRCCEACLTSDVNRDGDFGTDADIETFFRTMMGGCSP